MGLTGCNGDCGGHQGGRWEAAMGGRVGMVFVLCCSIGAIVVAETIGDLRDSSVSGDFMVSTICRSMWLTWE